MQFSTWHCHYLSAEQSLANKISEIPGTEFEEDGIPISLFELDAARNFWGIAIYVEADNSDNVRERMIRILTANDGTTDIKSEIITETDWVTKTLGQLSPVRAGRFLVHGSRDRQAVRDNDITIQIDAELAFGTGHHGSTLGCLEMLDQELKRQNFSNTLDLGTGSGILAIAMAKGTKSETLASDIDPVAVQTSQKNAQINNMEKLVTCVPAAGFNHRQITAKAPFDLIIANILSRPLQKMVPDFSRHLVAGATVILSGLLPSQKAPIMAFFRRQGMRLIKTHERDGWLTLTLRA